MTQRRSDARVLPQAHGTAATEPVPAVSVGQGALEVIAPDRGRATTSPAHRRAAVCGAGQVIGRVTGTFRGGFYVTAGDEATFVVLGPRFWPGPLHVLAGSELPTLPALHDPVTATTETLMAGRLNVSIARARRWAPQLPAGVCADPELWRAVAPRTPVDLADAWPDATVDLRRGDVASVFDRLAGLGDGSTPSGDDTLAGIALVAAVNPDNESALVAMARTARTTRLSRAFLRWAAAGQSIQPAHDVLNAAAERDPAGMRRAAQSLSSIGATSGRALLAGLALAATELRQPALLGCNPGAPQPDRVQETVSDVRL